MPTDLDFETFKRTAVSASEQFIEEYKNHGYAGLAAIEERLKRIANGDLPLPRRREKDALFYLMSKSPEEGTSILEQLQALKPLLEQQQVLKPPPEQLQELRPLLERVQALNEFQLERWREIARVRLFVLQDMLWSWALGLRVVPYSELSDNELQQVQDEFLEGQIRAWEYAVIATWVLIHHPQLSTLEELKEQIGAYRDDLDLYYLLEGREGESLVRTVKNQIECKGFEGFKKAVPREVYKRGITEEDLAEIEPSEDAGQLLRELAQL